MSRTALVVVDMQEYFCRPGHAVARFIELSAPGAADWYWQRLTTTVVPAIARLLADFRSRAEPVVFTEFGSRTPDACAAPLRESHEWALRVAIPTFATIVTAGDVITARPDSAAPAGL